MSTNYILFDSESTGNRREDRIIQLGLMIFEDLSSDNPIEVYSELNYSSVEMMYEAMEIHHITPEMIEGRRDLQDTDGYKRLVELNTPNTIFVSHDTPADLKMLKRDGFQSTMQILDTLKCAKHIYSELDAYRLQYLRYRLELYQHEKSIADSYQVGEIKAHDVIGDIIITKLLLSRLVLDAKREFGLATDQEAIEKLIVLSNTPVLIKRFQFGKYRGEYIDDIIHTDYRYIEWMKKNLELDEDMSYTLDYYL
jgi:DNA polymerase-3 subunit epsilon/exodeoxyribonuclease X